MYYCDEVRYMIVIKRKGVNFPDEKTLKTIWTNNPHGAGLMYANGENGKVYIDKGYMDWTAFSERIKTLGAPEVVRNVAVVIHFRIATQGSMMVPGDTQPFPITDNVASLAKLRCACKLGIAHNRIKPFISKEGRIDTRRWIERALAPYTAVHPEWYKDESLMEQMGKRIQNKLVVMDRNGEVAYYGDFIQESDGMLYSNTSYKPRFSAVYTFRDANQYEFEEELPSKQWGMLDGGLPPWDTGRKSVWLLPADVCNTGVIHYIGTRSDVVDDTEDLWVDSAGRVYSVDYDTCVAYQLSMSCSKHCGFRYDKGIRFEYGGKMPI